VAAAVFYYASRFWSGCPPESGIVSGLAVMASRVLFMNAVVATLSPFSLVKPEALLMESLPASHAVLAVGAKCSVFTIGSL